MVFWPAKFCQWKFQAWRWRKGTTVDVFRHQTSYVFMYEPSGSLVTRHINISSLISLQQYGLEEYALTKRSFVSPELCLFHLSSTTLQPKRELTRSHGRMIIIIHPFAVSFKNQIQIQRSTTGQCLHCVGSSYWMARARRESGERWVFLAGGWEDPRHWAVVLSKT